MVELEAFSREIPWLSFEFGIWFTNDSDFDLLNFDFWSQRLWFWELVIWFCTRKASCSTIVVASRRSASFFCLILRVRVLLSTSKLLRPCRKGVIVDTYTDFITRGAQVSLRPQEVFFLSFHPRLSSSSEKVAFYSVHFRRNLRHHWDEESFALKVPNCIDVAKQEKKQAFGHQVRTKKQWKNNWLDRQPGHILCSFLSKTQNSYM